MAQAGFSSAVRALQLELKKLNDEPVEGFQIRLVNDDNIFEWQVAIFGPPGTLYESGYFKALMKFPQDYPYSPPSVKFLCKMWHPNIYENGEVCISILHPPIDDPRSGELASERWNPTQNVRIILLTAAYHSVVSANRTILLSIISLLNEPNTSSPANVDASVAFRKWKDSNGKEKDYENIIRKQVRATTCDAERDGVIVPTTLQEYCVTVKPCSTDNSVDIDFYDDDYLDNNSDAADDDDDDDLDNVIHAEGEADSGHCDS